MLQTTLQMELIDSGEKYANKSYLEDNIGSATDIATAFRTGRAAIAAGNIDDALAQAEIIKTESKQMVAGMAFTLPK